MSASSAFRYAVVMAGLWWLVLRGRRERSATDARTRPPAVGGAGGIGVTRRIRKPPEPRPRA